MKSKLFFQKILLLLFVMCTMSVVSYGRQVMGTVTDEFGWGIPGVNVVVKGTNNGTITDVEGHYTISGNFFGPDSLVFTYIGMKRESVFIGSKTVINVVMREDSMMLTENMFQKQLLMSRKEYIFFDYKKYLKEISMLQIC